MATTFLSTAKPFLSSSTPSSLSSLTNRPLQFSCPQQKCNPRRPLTSCKALSDESLPVPAASPIIITRRSLSICFLTSFVFSLASRGSSSANAAILEADDDEELLEKVKRDRKKRLERQGVISSANKEKGYLQDLVYKLSKVGQAIDNNDLSTASSVLGGSTDTDWVKKANIAFTKLSSSPEEKIEVDTFNSSLSSLISSVTSNDIESSKIAFVSSATAFEKWTTLTGLFGQLKGL